MNEEKWGDALDCLNKGREDAKGRRGVKWPPEIYFYASICCLRLENWQSAKLEAELAKKHCVDNKDLLKQINNLLDQIEFGPIAKEMQSIKMSLDSEDWYRVSQLADEILKKKPAMPVVMFYKALSLFRMGGIYSMNSFDEAQAVISKFNRLSVSKPYEIQKQMDQISEAIPKARRNVRIGEISEHLNKGEFTQALFKAQKLNMIDECAEGHYFIALSDFQSIISQSKTGSLDFRSARSRLEDSLDSLDKADLLAWASPDKSIKDAIKNLKTAIKANLDQIRYY